MIATLSLLLALVPNHQQMVTGEVVLHVTGAQKGIMDQVASVVVLVSVDFQVVTVLLLLLLLQPQQQL